MLKKMLTKSVKWGVTNVFGHIPTKHPRILAYHTVDNSSSIISTSPSAFRRHLEFLCDNGYQTTTLSKLTADNGATSNKNVIITFDDAYESVYVNAFPILKEFGMAAVVFPVNNYVGKKASWIARDREHILTNLMPKLNMSEAERKLEEQRLQVLGSLSLMCWDEIREMSEQGIQFQSHSCSHPFFSTISINQIQDELGRSKDDLESRLKKKVEWFCYPYGDAGNSDVDSVLEELGYIGALTANYGRFHGDREKHYVMDRMPIYTGTENSDLKFCFSRAFDVLNDVGKILRR